MKVKKNKIFQILFPQSEEQKLVGFTYV